MPSDGHRVLVMDALHPPDGLVLPPWVHKRTAHNDSQRVLVLVLVRNVEYIGGGHALPLSHQNGQCSVLMDVPASQTRKLQEFPRFVPPTPCGTRGVVWEGGIGPGFRWEESGVGCGYDG